MLNLFMTICSTSFFHYLSVGGVIITDQGRQQYLQTLDDLSKMIDWLQQFSLLSIEYKKQKCPVIAYFCSLTQ